VRNPFKRDEYAATLVDPQLDPDMLAAEPWAADFDVDNSVEERELIVKVARLRKRRNQEWLVRKKVSKLVPGSPRNRHRVTVVVASLRDFPTSQQVEDAVVGEYGGGIYEIWARFPPQYISQISVDGDPLEPFLANEIPEDTKKEDWRERLAQAAMTKMLDDPERLISYADAYMMKELGIKSQRNGKVSTEDVFNDPNVQAMMNANPKIREKLALAKIVEASGGVLRLKDLQGNDDDADEMTKLGRDLVRRRLREAANGDGKGSFWDRLDIGQIVDTVGKLVSGAQGPGNQVPSSGDPRTITVQPQPAPALPAPRIPASDNGVPVRVVGANPRPIQQPSGDVDRAIANTATPAPVDFGSPTAASVTPAPASPPSSKLPSALVEVPDSMFNSDVGTGSSEGDQPLVLDDFVQQFPDAAKGQSYKSILQNVVSSGTWAEWPPASNENIAMAKIKTVLPANTSAIAWFTRIDWNGLGSRLTLPAPEFVRWLVTEARTKPEARSLFDVLSSVHPVTFGRVLRAGTRNPLVSNSVAGQICQRLTTGDGLAWITQVMAVSHEIADQWEQAAANPSSSSVSS